MNTFSNWWVHLSWAQGVLVVVGLAVGLYGAAGAVRRLFTERSWPMALGLASALGATFVALALLIILRSTPGDVACFDPQLTHYDKGDKP